MLHMTNFSDAKLLLINQSWWFSREEMVSLETQGEAVG